MRKLPTKWPLIDEVQNLRWTNNHTQLHSIGYGFCEAQDCCEECDKRLQMLCRIRNLIDKVRVKIILKHYGIKDGW